ncbi:MAG TPA: hypothetical protein VK658_28265 [Chryseolinea sp.]|nr:hypothetical protein [Chryseolinea sp.]
MNLVYSLMNKAQLKLALYDKQRLYHQMVKDKITGSTKEQVAKEIEVILTRLYVQAKSPT